MNGLVEDEWRWVSREMNDRVEGSMTLYSLVESYINTTA